MFPIRQDLNLRTNQFNTNPMKTHSDPSPCRFLAVLLFCALAAAGFAQNQASKAAEGAAPAATNAPAKKPDVIFVPTRMEVVNKMLEMAEIKTNDILYDLGCGDGRIVVTAARKYGIKAVGVDIDPQRVKESLENVRSNHVERLVTIKQADIFELDFHEASVVTLYLLPDLNVRLMPKLAKLKPGTRIISDDFDMQGAKPKEIVHVERTGDDEGVTEMQNTIYKWVVPWEPE